MKAENEKKEETYLISETARLVGVESHVLRYWEEELKLPIRRNELGHRYYTRDDVDQFKEIKKLKEQGLQLKAIRTVLTDSNVQVLVPLQERQETDKGARLQMLLHGLISQAVRENNEELVRQVKETILKEMDYQFRVQDEENDRREKERLEKEEAHYRRLDELLRQYSTKKPGRRERKLQREKEKAEKIKRKEERLKLRAGREAKKRSAAAEAKRMPEKETQQNKERSIHL